MAEPPPASHWRSLIRAAWVLLVSAIATLVLGSGVFVASLLGARGGLYTWIARRWSKILLWSSGVTVRVHGVSKVDWSRPHVVVCNHISAYDILALSTTIPADYHFVAKKELEKVPLFGPAWQRAGHISIDRSNRQKAIESLRRAAETIHRDGGVVVIFAEGTRSTSGELQPFKKGAFRLAIEAGVPIVPAVVANSDKIMAAGRIHVRKGSFDLYYDDPVSVDGYGPEMVDELIKVVRSRMEAIQKRTG